MTMRIITGSVLALLLSGCYTVDPLTMEKTARDEDTYEAPEPAPSYNDQRKVFIVSKVIAHQRARETNSLEFLSKAVESATSQYFSNLGWFRAIDRNNGFAVDASNVFAGTGADDISEAPASADLALVVESSAVFIAKQDWKKTSHSKKARGVQVESDFRLIGVKSREMLVGMKFRSSAECGKGDIRTAMTDAADMNVRKFARIVSARYLPSGRVSETRGSGRCARLTIGKNYLLSAKTDNQPATRVDFFEYGRDKDTGRIEKVVIAHGTVIAADKNEAWVEVDADWIDKTTRSATYNVKKGHYVRISEEAVENEVEVE